MILFYLERPINAKHVAIDFRMGICSPTLQSFICNKISGVRHYSYRPKLPKSLSVFSYWDAAKIPNAMAWLKMESKI